MHSPAGTDSYERPALADSPPSSWAVHPALAVTYLFGVLVAAATVAGAWIWLLGIVAAVIVYRDRAAMNRPAAGWVIAVLLVGPLAFLPYTLVRDRAGQDRPDGPAASPAGLVLAGAGAVGLALAAFLPVVDASAFFTAVVENSFIAGGDGWFLIAAAVVVVLAVVLAARGSRKWGWLALAAGLVGIAVAIVDGSGSALDVYPLDEFGQVDFTAEPSRASPGSGIYAAAVGGALAAVGGLITALTDWGAARRPGPAPPAAATIPPVGVPDAIPTTAWPGETARPATANTALWLSGGSPQPPSAPSEQSADDGYKTCPDCAERVRVAARVCRFCRHEFAATDETAR